jgi:transglutaminase-like putative cysteine protease
LVSNLVESYNLKVYTISKKVEVVGLKKLIVLLLVVYAFFYLSQKDMLPSIEQIESFLNLNDTEIAEQSNLDGLSLAQQEPSQPTATEQKSSTVPVTLNSKYQPTDIQTYQVTVANGKLVVTGKPTPYGKYNKADGVVLSIQEPRADKETTLKVPFTKEKINYEYPLIYNVGDVIINVDEYYNGKEDDPTKVLGHAQYQLTDGDPYLQPSYMIQSNDPGLMALAQNITNGKQSDLDKSKAIFAWVAKNIAYNAPLLNAENPPIYSALETYQNRIVLCTGYADLSAALHRAVGIGAKVSYGENHAWNEILLNGVWQPEDPTYGAGFINADTNKFVRKYEPAYFSKTDKNKEGEYPF